MRKENNEKTAADASNILLVEDNLEVARLLCELLRVAGYTVRHATTASEGLLLGLSQPPSVFVLDVDLPDADGFQLCRALKADPRTAAIPVVFCTGRLDAHSLAQAAGGVDCLSKPFEVLELPERLRRALIGKIC